MDKKNKIMKSVGKWIELGKKIILNEVLKTKKKQIWNVFAFMWVLAVKSLIPRLQSVEPQRLGL